MVVMIGHPFSNSSGNQDIDYNIEVWNFVSKFDMDGLIDAIQQVPIILLFQVLKKL